MNEDIFDSIEYWKKYYHRIYFFGTILTVFISAMFSLDYISIQNEKLQKTFFGNIVFPLIFSINFFVLGFALEIKNLQTILILQGEKITYKHIFKKLKFRFLKVYSNIFLFSFLIYCVARGFK